VQGPGNEVAGSGHTGWENVVTRRAPPDHRDMLARGQEHYPPIDRVGPSGALRRIALRGCVGRRRVLGLNVNRDGNFGVAVHLAVWAHR
jgi:hypothetical protein